MNFKKPYFWDLPKPNLLSYFLVLFSLPIILRNFFFNKKKRKKFTNIKTICVGNVYIGGTGKTPLVIKIYEILNNLGIRVATVKKDYPNQIDEQLILKKKTSSIISKSRRNAIRKGIKDNYEMLIFDDGLQDMYIEYDLKMVCFKSKNWIGNGLLIPAGPMREKISSLKKFDVVFLNVNSENFEEIESKIKNINSKIKIFKTKYKILNIKKYNLNLNYLIFSGIGNPSDFKEILLKNNFNIVKEIIFPDHYEYSHKDFEKIYSIAKDMKLKILTTEKDYIKIPNNFKKEIDFLEIDLIIENENKLLNLLKN